MPYHWGRYRGLAQDMKRPPLDGVAAATTCSSTPASITKPGIDLLAKVIPVENILFASEMVGAVRGIDPETGHYFDDTKRYIEAAGLTAADRQKIYEDNARHVYGRLSAQMAKQGIQ